MAEETKDTSATTEPVEKNSTEKTPEQAFAEYSKQMADMALAGLPASLEEDTAETTSTTEETQAESSETEEQEETETAQTDEEQKIEQAPEVREVEFEVDGKAVKLDLNIPEQLEKAKTYMRNGYKTENIHDAKVELENQTKLLQQVYFGNQMLYLRNIAQGEIPFEEPLQKDYLNEDGKFYYNFDSDDDRKKAYRNIKKNYDTIVIEKGNYENSLKQSYPVYVNTVKEFAKAHPDIENKEKWIANNIDPIVNAILSVGAMSIPRDLFEAIYFYQNKDVILSKAIQEDRKKMTVKTQTSKPKTTTVKKEEKKVDWEKQIGDTVLAGLPSPDTKVKFKFR